MFGKAACAALLVMSSAALAQSGAPEASPRHPAGIPGFYDPLSHKFTPLAKARSAQTFSGVQTVKLKVLANKRAERFDSVSCAIVENFGLMLKTSFFVTQSIRTFVSMAPDQTQTAQLPYTFVPGGQGKPAMQTDIDCNGNETSGPSYFSNRSLPEEPATDRPRPVNVALYLGD